MENLNQLASVVADRADTPIDEVKKIQAVTFDVIFAYCDLQQAKNLLILGVNHAADRVAKQAELARKQIEEKRNLFR